MAALTASDYKASLRSETDLKGIVKWAGVNGGLNKIEALIAQAVASQWKITKFLSQLRGLAVYARYQEFLGAGGEDEVPEGPKDEEDKEEDPVAKAGESREDVEDIRQLLREFLEENLLPVSLMGFIENALAQGWSYERIVYELRRTPEYKSVYPENEARLAAGFEWMSEAEIRAYRAEARRLAEVYFGYSPSNVEIGEMLIRDKSLVEFERQMQDYFNMQQYGPAVQQALEYVLGYTIDDQQLWKFFSRDWKTPELDRAYEKALLMGQPAVLGLGIRPEEEADILRSYGISPEEAFRGYQGIAAELPRRERLSAIEAEITRLGDRFPQTLGVSFSDLFKAIQLRDMDSILKLEQQIAREVARWQAGGGPAGGGAGLLPPELR